MSDPIEGTWNGQPQWRCPFCGWDTLISEEAVREHIAGRHPESSPVAGQTEETQINASFFAHVLRRYSDLVAIVGETQRGRDRLVKDGFAEADANGDLWLTYGVDGVLPEPTGLAAKKADDDPPVSAAGAGPSDKE